jgi:hypothetical protein
MMIYLFYKNIIHHKGSGSFFYSITTVTKKNKAYIVLKKRRQIRKILVKYKK